MISVHKIAALYWKQLKNFSYNMFIMCVFLIVPLFAFLFARVVPGLSVMALSFSVLMSTVLGGANTMCVLIAEEKEKNTLPVLITSTVSAMDFLLSNLLATLTVTVACNLIVYAFCADFTVPFLAYLLVTTAASITSIVLGAAVGLVSKNQMTASSIISPFALILIMVPMFSGLIPAISTVGDALFSQQLLIMLGDLTNNGVLMTGLLVTAANLVVLTLVFVLVYRRVGLEK